MAVLDFSIDPEEARVILEAIGLFQDRELDRISEQASDLVHERMHEDCPVPAVRERIRKMTEIEFRIQLSESLFQRLIALLP